MINKIKIKYVNLFIDYVITNYKHQVKQIIVYGDSIDELIKYPNSIDIAIYMVNESDNTNFELLGDLLSYLGDIVDKGDCSLLPISNKILNNSLLNNIKKGVVVYELC